MPTTIHSPLSLAHDAAQAAGLADPTRLALSFRLLRGAWPWRFRLHPERGLRREDAPEVRAELAAAGFLTNNGRPDLLAIRAAAEVYRAVGGVRR